MGRIPHTSTFEPTPEERVRWRYPAAPPWANGEPPRNSDDTEPLDLSLAVRHQLIETDMRADPPLPKLWTDELTQQVDDALEMIRAHRANNRRILRRMREMMRNDGQPQ